MNLVIFLVSGKTYTFRNVEIATNNETMLIFTYKSASDNKQKTAEFYKQHVAGISTTIKEEVF